jgi:glycosyl transferase family 25
LNTRNIFTDIIDYIKTIKDDQSNSVNSENLGQVFKYPVFVINLERSLWRKEFMTRYLRSMGVDVRIFPAVDGRQLELDELTEQGVYDDEAAHEYFSRSLTMGEIGCTLSHLAIHKKMVDESIPMAMVLEDDVTLESGVSVKLKHVLKELPEDWDLVQFFYRTNDIELLSDNVVKFLYKPRMPVGSLGYLIKLSGARKMIKEAYPVRYPADSLMGRSYRWGLNIYGVTPMQVKLNNLFPTDIHEQQNLIQKLTYQGKQVVVKALGSAFSKKGKK